MKKHMLLEIFLITGSELSEKNARDHQGYKQEPREHFPNLLSRAILDKSAWHQESNRQQLRAWQEVRTNRSGFNSFLRTRFMIVSLLKAKTAINKRLQVQESIRGSHQSNQIWKSLWWLCGWLAIWCKTGRHYYGRAHQEDGDIQAALRDGEFLRKSTAAVLLLNGVAGDAARNLLSLLTT